MYSSLWNFPWSGSCSIHVWCGSQVQIIDLLTCFNWERHHLWKLRMIGLPGESSSNTSPAPRAFSLILCRAPFIVPHFPIKIIRKRAMISGSVYRFSFTLPKKGYIYVIIYNSKGEEQRNDLKAGLKRTFHPTQIGRLLPQFLSKGLHDAQTARLIAIQEFKESVGFAHLDISAASGGFGLKEFLICSEKI